jgi:hypothetical protein
MRCHTRAVLFSEFDRFIVLSPPVETARHFRPRRHGAATSPAGRRNSPIAVKPLLACTP